MHVTLVNLLGVAIVAFLVPFILGFFPRVRIPSVTLELDLFELKGAPLVRGSLSYVLSPLLVTIALSATPVGILVPVLRDTGHLAKPVGHFALSGGSAAVSALLLGGEKAGAHEAAEEAEVAETLQESA